LGVVIDKARKAGLVDWSAIEDRTRFLRRIPTYDGLPEFIKRTQRNYARDLWARQDCYCEVWIEKDALLGVIERPCLEYRVPYFACRGYPSSSELYNAGKRLARKADQGKGVFVFYLGDFDPSGLDMDRSNDESLSLLGRTYDINVERLSLTRDQIDEHTPPPNPAKESDSRFEAYLAEHGDESWELDAMPPAVLDGLVRDRITSLIDFELWDEDQAQEHSEEQLYARIGRNIEEIRDMFNEQDRE
jgi:hypothetical protein